MDDAFLNKYVIGNTLTKYSGIYCCRNVENQPESFNWDWGSAWVISCNKLPYYLDNEVNVFVARMIIINLQKSDSQPTIKETCKQTKFSAYYLLHLNKIYQRHTLKIMYSYE